MRGSILRPYTRCGFGPVATRRAEVMDRTICPASSSMSSFGEWIRRAALMTALAGAALQVGAGTVDYTLYGTFQTSSYTIDGVRVTGSSDVGVFQFNGLGVMGGIDFWLDGQEYLDFTFTQGPAMDVSYF